MGVLSFIASPTREAEPSIALRSPLHWDDAARSSAALSQGEPPLAPARTWRKASPLLQPSVSILLPCPAWAPWGTCIPRFSCLPASSWMPGGGTHRQMQGRKRKSQGTSPAAHGGPAAWLLGPVMRLLPLASGPQGGDSAPLGRISRCLPSLVHLALSTPS